MKLINKIIFLFTTSLFINISTAQNNNPGTALKNIEAQTKTGIVLAGSSITWGDGTLCHGFSGKVIDYIMADLSSVCMCEQMKYSPDSEEFFNSKQYKGIGRKINQIHSKVEFDLMGDEIAICQTIIRTSNYGVMQVKADGKIIGRFSNHNPTFGNDSQTFIGTGSQLQFQLNNSATFAHEVKVDGKQIEGEIYSGGWSREIPENKGYLIIRKFNEKQQPLHYLWFKEAPEKGTIISVKYSYGRVVSFEGSTVGQTNTDETNESNYGEGNISFDYARPAILASGLEYRYIDKSSFWIHKFTENKRRHFEIEIVDGDNPYFIINFASNRFHNMMNAGIGGWALSKLLDEDGINDYNNFFKYFNPDILINESATNDDWAFGERKLRRTLTGLTENEVKGLWALELDSISYHKNSGDYSVRVCTGLISNVTEFSISCPQIIASNVVKGDIIRIGNYHGDNRQVICREISKVDLEHGKVEWLEPLNPNLILNVNILDDLIGAECSIRDLSEYQKEYELLIQRIQNIDSHVQILITQPGLSNYRARQLWGYEIIHRKLAGMYHNVNTVEITDYLYDFQNQNISGNSYIEIEANGSNEYILPWKRHWQGFEVWVDNQNVYGKNCYIDGGYGYSVNQFKNGDEIEINRAYDKSHQVEKEMRLVFTENLPQSGTIRILKADFVWSDDFCHPNSAGAYLYGEIYKSRIKDILH